MLRAYRGLHRLEWTSDQSVNFHLGYGDWVRLLRANGFEIENLVELYPAEGATATDFPYATNEWARQWPTEEVWIARISAVVIGVLFGYVRLFSGSTTLVILLHMLPGDPLAAIQQ